jgi:protein-S-isoprenylcysteine O-methyltransferase Ste14
LARAIGLPLGLLALVFLPAGRVDWAPGWFFIAFVVVAYCAAFLVLARVNPAIFRTRSRLQPGTERWDVIVLWLMIPAVIMEIPLAALDAGRMSWSAVPPSIVALGYILLGFGIALTTWAQAVNPFFEKGVRLQRERYQRVITSGPYAIVRHPGYVGLMTMFAGIALSLASWWALVPAFGASAVLILRTCWEDELLQRKLAGYSDYSERVRFRLVPKMGSVAQNA